MLKQLMLKWKHLLVLTVYIYLGFTMYETSFVVATTSFSLEAILFMHAQAITLYVQKHTSQGTVYK